MDHWSLTGDLGILQIRFTGVIAYGNMRFRSSLNWDPRTCERDLQAGSRVICLRHADLKGATLSTSQSLKVYSFRSSAVNALRPRLCRRRQNPTPIDILT